MTKQKRMAGTWSSPLSPKQMTAARRFNDAQWADDTLVWSETRGGQTVLVAQPPGQAPRDLTDPGMAIRGRVGYGGGEFRAGHDMVIFSADGRLYRQALSGGRPRAITPAFGASAAPAFSPDGKWIVYVHSYENSDGLALVDTAGEHFPRKFAYGTDFVMQPVWSSDGTRIAFVTWDHPGMPFLGTQLKLALVERDHAGVPYAARIETLAGGAAVSIFQPEFAPDGKRLAYISDASGWSQLYVYDFASGEHIQLTDAPAEHGVPAWTQGLRTYAWSPDGRALFYVRHEQTAASLWRCDWRARRSERVRGAEKYTSLEQISVSPRGEIALIASSSTQPPRVISVGGGDDALPLLNYDAPGTLIIVDEPGGERIYARASSENLTGLATAEPISFPAADGETVHALYYPPTSDRYEDAAAPPPLIVYVHGGPTSHADLSFSLRAQFFATRGYAYVEVNHRGSTGYGRAYMDRLRGAWGVYDVDDSADAARHLVARGLADPRRLVIMGTSAGGFTVLASLVKLPGFYRAGIAGYPVTEQFSLALETHKFEASYNDYLLGALPEAAALYRERSPLFHADQIRDALLLFHGADDPVVPLAQSDSVVAALRARGVPHEYHVYAGEGHGWRKPETTEDYYAKILNFLKQYVVFA